ncbi:MAG: radical SAM protein [Dehalococcoidia bacterium]|nr:radical SAM protein [Dehalococcoidia bacterium]
MAEFTHGEGLGLLLKGLRNYVSRQPLIVSFETTLSCNCNCRHCDLGGLIADEVRMTPKQYGEYTAEFKPPLVQLSGGEPLLRDDIVDIVRAVKTAHKPTYVILVTNGALLNKDIYLKLKDAGMNQLSVSLDFPDARHDDFRRHRGLFAHLESTLPELAQLGFGDIIMNTAITRANMGELLAISDVVERWGVTISYSAYTQLRTGDPEYMISTAEDLEALDGIIESLIVLSRSKKHIANPETVFRDTLKYFHDGGMKGCSAGVRFFVVMPDGALVPCSLHREKYKTQREMVADFTSRNTCDSCYVAIRSYSDKSMWRLLSHDLPSLANRLFSRYIPSQGA